MSRIPATLEIATKLSFALSSRFSVGLENYNGIGELRHFGHFGSNEQSTFLAAETAIGNWNVNLGLGHGYGSNPDKWILKAIVSVPLGLSLNHRRSSLNLFAA